MSDPTPVTDAPVENAKDRCTVIIPTYQAAHLCRLLDGILAQRDFDRLGEVLVVGQQEGADRFASLPKIRYLHVDERPTPARNRNIGAQEAKGEWLCFLDSDVVPQVEWLSEMEKATASGASALAGGVIIPEDAGYWERCDNLLAFENQIAETAGTDHVVAAATINFAIRRSLFLSLNGFDESFTTAAGEDRDLCWRLENLGYRIPFVPGAAVVHRHVRLDRQSAVRHFYRYGEAATQFRTLRGDHLRWRLAAIGIRLPLLGEIGGLIRVVLRAVLRPIRKPVYLTRFWHEMPGLLILDWAHTRGMLHALRQRKVQQDR